MDGAELMQRVAAGIEKSDLQPLHDALHKDIVWKSASSREGLLRFGGEYKTPTGLLGLIAILSRHYTFYCFKPKEILVTGDIVWGHFAVGVLYDLNGSGEQKKHITLEMAVRWKLKDGKVLEHQAFFDTASLLLQQGSKLVSPE